MSKFNSIHLWAVSPDRKIALSLSNLIGAPDGNAQTWDVNTGKDLSPRLRINCSHPMTAIFTPDSKSFATFCNDKTVRLWDAQTGKPVGPVIRTADTLSRIAFSPDGKIILAGGNTLQLWDAESGAAIGKPLPTNGGLGAAAFSPNGKMVVTADAGNISLWDVVADAQLKPRWRCNSPAGSFSALAFSPDGKTVLSASGKTAQLWDVDGGCGLGPPMQHSSPVYAVAFSLDGKQLLTADNWGAYLWESDTGTTAGATFPQKKGGRVALSPDSRTAVLFDQEGSASLWEITNGKRLSSLPFGGYPQTAQFSPDGRSFLTAHGRQGTIWKLSTGKQLGDTMLKDQINHVDWVFAPGGGTILSGGKDGMLRQWEAGSGKLLRETPSPEAHSVILAIAPAGYSVASTGADNKVVLWDAQTGHEAGPPLCHDEKVVRAMFSSEGRVLATVSESRTVRVWDTRTRKLLGPPLRHEVPVSAVAVSRDGKRVVIGTISSGRMVEVASGKQIGPVLADTATYDVALGHDDSTVLVSINNIGAPLWRTASVTGDPARIILWAEVLTGLELDVNSRPQAISFKERSQRRRKLAELGGPPWP